MAVLVVLRSSRVRETLKKNAAEVCRVCWSIALCVRIWIGVGLVVGSRTSGGAG